jgi:PfaD family protein
VDRVVSLRCGAAGQTPHGSISGEYDIPEGAWYLRQNGRICPEWVVNETIQTAHLLFTAMGLDRLWGNEGRVRFLRMTRLIHSRLPEAGDSLRTEVKLRPVTGSRDHGFVLRLEARAFTNQRLFSTGEIVLGAWPQSMLAASRVPKFPKPRPPQNPAAPAPPPPCRTERRRLSRDETARLMAGDIRGTLGENFPATLGNSFGERASSFIDQIDEIDYTGGPWGRGLLRAGYTPDPKHWVFKCHFPGDPVWPGNLLTAGAAEALALFLVIRGHGEKPLRIRPIPDIESECRFLGQVLPDHGAIEYRLLIKDVRDHPTPRISAVAEISLQGRPVAWLDNVAIELLPDTAEESARLTATPARASQKDSPPILDATPDTWRQVLANIDLPITVSHGENGPRLTQTREVPGPKAALAHAPACPLASFGEPSFLKAYNVRAACMSGAMAHGIASVELVTAMVRAGFLASFGAGGLSAEEIRHAVERLRKNLPGQTFAVNLLHSPQEPRREEEVVAICRGEGVSVIEAAAFIRPTPALVHYRVSGLHQIGEPVMATHRVIAKISRPEVARCFLAPPPPAIVRELLKQGRITEKQARLAARVPLADDVTVEGDSAGHTDGRPLHAMLPVIKRLRDELCATHDLVIRPRVGAAGGLGDPEGVLSAFWAGAAYVVLGSINQATVEAGTSALAKTLLAQAGITDFALAPAADMFEMGAKVQVLTRGTRFAAQARKLGELYHRYNSLDDVPPAELANLERKLFKKPVDQVWEDIESFFAERAPDELKNARSNARHKLALICRAYLGRSIHWALRGEADQQADFQIWCGPAMGAFNDWARGSRLEALENRHVSVIAEQLLRGAAYHHRVRLLEAAGVRIPQSARCARPIQELCKQTP